MTRTRRGLVGVLLGLVAALLAGGCASGSGGGADEDAVPRPEWRGGDRWVFRRTDSLTGTTTVVTHQVTAASGDGYTMGLRGLGTEETLSWTIDLHLRARTAGGRNLETYEPPLMYVAWPLRLGKTWTQEFDYRDGSHDGHYTNAWQVGAAVEPVHVLAGSFYAVRIEHRGSQGERLDTYWYSPRVRYWVKLENYRSRYVEELVEAGPPS